MNEEIKDENDYINEKRKNKVLNMIKNAHIEKIRNFIYLKEINFAFEEIQRFIKEGDFGSAKEMERELNSLQMDVIEHLHRDLIQKAGMGEFTHRMRDMERQLTETENERDNLMATEKVLEDELHQLRARVDELEQRLASIPKAGRPDVYDADFRARVKAYYEKGSTYRETASHFGISTNTVGRILKE
jgi:DNA-binding transcriptional MerR regulator